MRGFSLLELLLALFISGILLTLGHNQLSLFFERYQGELFIRQLQNFLNYGQYLAVTKNSRVILCGSDNQETCTRSWDKFLLLQTMEGEAIKTLPLKGELVFKNQWHHNYQIVFLPNGLLADTRGSFFYYSKHYYWRLVVLPNGFMRTELKLKSRGY